MCAALGIAALALGLTGCATDVGAEGDDVAALKSNLLSPPQCSRLAELANVEPIKSLLLARADGVMKGHKEDGKFFDREFEITGVKSASFSGCRLTMKVGMTLHRPGARRDGKGTAHVNGNVYAAQRNFTDENGNPATQALICLRDLNTTDFDLSHTTNIAENIYGRNGGIDDECFNDDDGLWALFDSDPEQPLVYEQM
jgi:hypothetical protein